LHDIPFDARETIRLRRHPTGMQNLSRVQTIVSWLAQLTVAGILTIV
jgi:hypothetical protein